MDTIITPKKLKGQVNVPSSKSYAHRAIISACLAKGESIIHNVSFSDDINATISGMTKIGATIEKLDDKTLKINGISKYTNKNICIDCYESGSTLRFLVPIVGMFVNGKVNFVGRGKLGTRPMDIYEDIFNMNQLFYEDHSKNNADRCLDLYVEGSLPSQKYEVDGGVSSQFITGLMFALSLKEEDSEIVIKHELMSSDYIAITLSVLKDFGVKIENYNNKRFYIRGNQEYKSIDYTVEGDYSQEAFFEIANLIGNDINVLGMNSNSIQGDKVIIDFANKIKNANGEKLVFDCKNCPDIVPVLSVGLALYKGESHLVNVERLRIKECDRLEAICEELGKLGANIEIINNELFFKGNAEFKGAVTSSHSDHRIAMMLAIAATCAKGEVTILESQCVSKSYPKFFEDYVAIGGQIR